MTEKNDRRSHHRRAATLQAWAILNDQAERLPCTVQNMSASGAQLTFPTAIDLPPQIRLEIPQLSLEVDATVAWSRAEHHGITFVWPQHTRHR
jgi:hypothetical protein